MKRQYVILENFGMLYRLSTPKLKKYLKAKAAGEDVYPDKYGKLIGTIYLRVSDLDVDQAQSALETAVNGDEPSNESQQTQTIPSAS